MSLFEVAAKLFLDDKDYNKGIDDAEKKASGLGKGLKAAAGIGAAGMTALASATVKLGKDLVTNSKEVAQHGDQVDKMSQKLGLSTDAYQKWDYVLSQSGADINSMQTGLKTLTNKLDEAKSGSAEAQSMFSKLGLSMQDLASMSREEAFEATITGFQGMADSTERAALANDLFGRSGQELTPLFNTTAEETRNMMTAAEELGMVMSEDAVSASAAFNDSLDTMQRTLGGVKNNLVAEFLPSITTVMDGLTQIFAGDTEGGMNLITSGITDLINNLSDAVPQILEVGSQIVLTIGEAIVENAPNLISSAAQTIETIGMGIVENLPKILDSALEIILSLAEGLTNSLPQIIPAVVSVVMTIAEKLTEPDTLSSLLSAGLELIGAIAEGLINSIPELVPAVIDIIFNLSEFLLDHIDTVLNAAAEIGTRLVEALWQAILDMAGWIKEKLSGFFNSLFKSAKKDLEIQSPSKVWMRGIGKPMGQGLVVGFIGTLEDSEGEMISAVRSIGETMTGEASGIASDISDSFDSGFDIGSTLDDVQAITHSVVQVATDDRVQDEIAGMMGDLLHLLRAGGAKLAVSNARDMRTVSYG